MLPEIAPRQIPTTSRAAPGKLPTPFAISSALIIAFWGMWNVIDGNYWAVRAIAFLANVEATYFAEEDRRHFNPYAGRHPPFKLLDSLKYQFLAISLFAVLTMLYFGWRVFGQGYGTFLPRLSNLNLVS